MLPETSVSVFFMYQGNLICFKVQVRSFPGKLGHPRKARRERTPNNLESTLDKSRTMTHPGCTPFVT